MLQKENKDGAFPPNKVYCGAFWEVMGDQLEYWETGDSPNGSPCLGSLGGNGAVLCLETNEIWVGSS